MDFQDEVGFFGAKLNNINVAAVASHTAAVVTLLGFNSQQSDARYLLGSRYKLYVLESYLVEAIL